MTDETPHHVEAEPCQHCEGTGIITEPLEPGGPPTRRQCPDCNGQGWIATEDDPS